MTQVVTESSHAKDEILDAVKSKKAKTVTCGAAVTPELLEQIDKAIAHLNTRFPAYLQCNRSTFVLGAIMLALKDVDAMVNID